MLKERLLQYAESIVKRATYTINGVVKEGTIGKVTRSGDSITFYIYIDDETNGTITNAKLYDVNNELLESKDLKMSTLNAKVFLIFSLLAICTIDRAVLLCNFHIIQVWVLE